MAPKKLSGCQNRKRRLQREEEAKKHPRTSKHLRSSASATTSFSPDLSSAFEVEVVPPDCEVSSESNTNRGTTASTSTPSISQGKVNVEYEKETLHENCTDTLLIMNNQDERCQLFLGVKEEEKFASNANKTALISSEKEGLFNQVYIKEEVFDPESDCPSTYVEYDQDQTMENKQQEEGHKDSSCLKMEDIKTEEYFMDDPNIHNSKKPDRNDNSSLDVAENFSEVIMSNKKLKRNQIEELLNGFDQLEHLNNSDIDNLSDQDEIDGEGSYEPASLVEFGDDELLTMEIVENNENFNVELPGRKKRKIEKEEKVKWGRKDFIPPNIEEWEDTVNSHEPRSPLQYFCDYIPDDIFESFAENTNIYYLQRQGKVLGVTKQEIRQLIGLHIEMGSMGFPRLRLYWNNSRKHDLIANCMTFNRFCALRNNLHIVNNLLHDEADEDKFWKVRPLMNAYAKALSLLEREKRVCVDEQMIPFKGSLSFKQYIKGKPTPWGIKLFFLCGESGIPYSFIAYQGKSTKLPEEYSHLGIGGSVVMKLTEETLEPFEGHRMFFDNFFTSPALVKQLAYYGIYSTGTVRANRVGGFVPMKSVKELSQEGRGSMDGCTSEDGLMCLTRWNDNSMVQVLSSAYAWNTDDCKVLRWDKTKRQKREIPCPPSVMQYNQSMGGVDKLDFLLALYRIHIKSKKWTLRVIFHFIDLAVVTSWLQYKRDCKSCAVPNKNQLDLLSFRMELAEALTGYGVNPLVKPKVGRPINEGQQHKSKKKQRQQTRPQGDVRFDGIGHFPQWNESRNKCKAANCLGKSYIICIKCKVTLCLNKDRNCFSNFHT